MLYTAFMLVMFGWMLLLVLQFGMAALPVVILLTAIMTSIRLVQYASFTRTKALVRLSAKAR
jgi:hypothetical protein